MMLVALKAGPLDYSEERYDAVRVLWAQVLKRAMFDYVMLKGSSNIKSKRIFKSAEQWLFSNEYGLIDTCSALGWSLEALRARARSMTKKDIRKMEFRDRENGISQLPEVRTLGLEHGHCQ